MVRHYMEHRKKIISQSPNSWSILVIRRRVKFFTACHSGKTAAVPEAVDRPDLLHWSFPRASPHHLLSQL